jgi:lactoylglutathione lyase
MNGRIALVTILADNVLSLIRFYCDALGLEVKSASGDYVELQNGEMAFAICSRALMESVTGHPSYGEPKGGQSFGLAFPVHTHEQVDEVYASVLAKGAMPVQSPILMPWGQRTAFFADPEGNIHRLFADLPRVAEPYW